MTRSPSQYAARTRHTGPRAAHALCTAIVVLLCTLAAKPAAALEEPAFTLVQRDGAFELRDYAPCLLAETKVDGEFDDASDAAFKRLFSYIRGANAGERSIAMTSPVTQRTDDGTRIAMTAPVAQRADGRTWRVALVVPRTYTRATVPRPTDARVGIVEVAARRVAVWRFSGRWTLENFTDAETQLRAAITRAGLRASGPATIARYDPPFAPPFMRRNEVQIEVVPNAAR